ncbi:MAG TPA: CBS domain-containing protein [Actinoallomurus sp.]|nr:CBS domain-containing protein [Actinoallomurus sp.]
MSDRVIAVHQNAEFSEIVDAMRRFHIASLPVIDAGDHVIGLISEDDVLAKETYQGGRSRLFGRFRRRTGPSKAAGTIATELMSSPAVTVTRSTSAREAARAMFRHRVHQLPVVDAISGRLIGIITRSDLLAVYERPAEDIRREVRYDIIEAALAMVPERFTVDVDHGTVTLRGEVEDRCAARVLTDAVRNVDGVVTVVDELTYRHGGDPAGRSPADP